MTVLDTILSRRDKQYWDYGFLACTTMDDKWGKEYCRMCQDLIVRNVTLVPYPLPTILTQEEILDTWDV